MKRLFVYFLLLSVCFSCGHRFGIEERAIRQVHNSLPEELESYCDGVSSWRTEDMKTVYVNDSVCILQFTARFRDSADVKYVRDLRYTYLNDRLESIVEGRMVYKESFLNTLCMPDELIGYFRDDIKKRGESVYESAYGLVLPIHNPID